MPVLTIQTLSARLQQITQRLLQNDATGDISVSPSSVFSKVFINPEAVSDVQQNTLSYLNDIGYAINDILATAADANTVNLLAAALNTTTANVLQLLSQMLDRIGSNFNNPASTRKGVAAAVGSVYFGTPTPPTVDVDVGVGTAVKDSAGNQFTTTAAAVMVFSQAQSYFNSDLLLYIIQIPVQAVVAGSASNVPVGGIVAPVQAVTGLPVVGNLTPIQGGRDVETDQEYGQRLLSLWQAIGAVTPAGIVTTATANLNAVVSAYVAKPGDALAVRGAGKADIWIQGQQPQQVVETFSAFNHPTIPGAVLPTSRPLLALVSTSTAAAVPRFDQTSPLAASVQSLDGIQFTTPPTFPVQITYVYDAAVAAAQSLYDQPQYSTVTQVAPVDAATAMATPLLAKAGQQLLLDYAVTIQVAPGYVAAVVVAAVVAALEAYQAQQDGSPTGTASAFVLGGTVYQDDLNKVVEAVPGVVRLSGDPTKFSPTGQAGVLNSVTAANTQYPVLNNVNIFSQ